MTPNEARERLNHYTRPTPDGLPRLTGAHVDAVATHLGETSDQLIADVLEHFLFYAALRQCTNFGLMDNR